MKTNVALIRLVSLGALLMPGLGLAQLPAPSGPFPVGTSVVALSDPSRTAPGRLAREIGVQVWYPAAPHSNHPLEAYLPGPHLLGAMKDSRYFDLHPGAIEAWKNVPIAARRNATMAASPRRLPVLLFSPGLGVSRSNYAALLQEIASHGYVVVALDHPCEGFSTTPDGAVLTADAQTGRIKTVPARVREMVRDAEFALDALFDATTRAGRFAHRLDRARIGMVGHSLGGAAALEAARQTRVRAAVDLDGDPWGAVETQGVARPFLVVLNEPEESKRPPVEMREQRDQLWRDVVAKGSGPAAVVKVGGTTHLSFTDFPFLLPHQFVGKGASLPPARTLSLTVELVHAFFRQHLDAAPTTLEAVVRRHPELSLLPLDEGGRAGSGVSGGGNG